MSSVTVKGIYDNYIIYCLWIDYVKEFLFEENTDGYTEFEAICNVRVIRKRPFTTATTCANYCDDNNKCQGFQISKNQCILLDKKCEAKDLIQVQNASSPAKYYLKGNDNRLTITRIQKQFVSAEVACNVSATCKMASNCFAPRGFSCACWTGYCRLNQTSILANFTDIINWANSWLHFRKTCRLAKLSSLLWHLF